MIIIVAFQLYAQKVIVGLLVLSLKRVMCISCRRHVDAHKGEWGRLIQIYLYQFHVEQ